ncbi:tetratricopeptide repeat protein 14 homolog isoform X2 [Haematobia irritans]|uniref:tetratricopeptide repeat protein 14 homolog isoform X2 n=1 Tax=Haematobia irritans TaxID=7368 RepID=UPI003F50598D
MDGDLIKRALCFHGKPMQKIWDDERGAGDLRAVGVPEDGNYSIYMERQKHFTFQDRAKRLKLHQFLARKAVDLYDKDSNKIPARPSKLERNIDDKNASIVVEMPPYEIYLTKHEDKVKRHILESLKTGDIVYAQVIRGKSNLMPLPVKPLCTDENDFKLLRDYKLKTYIPTHLCGPPLTEKNGLPVQLVANDFVRCELVDMSIDAERMTLSLESLFDTHKNKKLGKITEEELPHLYSKINENANKSFEQILYDAKELENPNYDILYSIVGLNVNDNFTMMHSLKNPFPPHEYAKELRQTQASKWAFRSVAEGIEYFKVGQHVEAFQCLNKALSIDPRNVEGLVARGALFANKGSFLKAVEDFEKALKLNSFHANARKYMGETLVALGRSYEEDNRIQEAAKAYRDCLNIIPNHDQASMLLEAIQQRTGASVDAIQRPTLRGMANQPTDKIPTVSLFSESEDSSSDSETDSDEPTTTNNQKESSLSPLSKKLALHAQELEASKRHFEQPYYMCIEQPNQAHDQIPQQQVFPDDFKLDEDDTETRVRKLLQEASKHKKDKKKTKKSKKSKKSKKGTKSSKDLDTPKYGAVDEIKSREMALNENLKLYEKSIELLRKRQELLDQPSTSTLFGARKREKSESPPPAPSIRTTANTRGGPGGSVVNVGYHTIGFGKFPKQAAQVPTTSTTSNTKNVQKFSFQIKRPVKVDKFGLVRLTTPPPLDRSRSSSPKLASPRGRTTDTRDRSTTRSRSHSRRRSRSRSRSRGRRHWQSSRSRSLSRGRYGSGRRRRRSSSMSSYSSRSGSYSRRKRDSRSRSRSRGRRWRSPSSDRSSRSRSSSRRYRHRSRSPWSRGSYRGRGRGRGRGGFRGGYNASNFGNRVWKNPQASGSPKSPNPSSSNDKWPHDKYNDNHSGDDPTIEEIDEIISKAQRERKQNIIENDKDILKKPNKW